MSRAFSRVVGCTLLAVLVSTIFYNRKQVISVSKLSPDTQGKLFECRSYNFIRHSWSNVIQGHKFSRPTTTIFICHTPTTRGASAQSWYQIKFLYCLCKNFNLFCTKFSSDYSLQ